jgi:hypothetical protein
VPPLVLLAPLAPLALMALLLRSGMGDLGLGPAAPACRLLLAAAPDLCRPLPTRAQASKASASWRAYVDWFSEIVIDGFAAAIVASVRYLLAQIDPAQLNRPDAVPLLEVRPRPRPPSLAPAPCPRRGLAPSLQGCAALGLERELNPRAAAWCAGAAGAGGARRGVAA